ncbi:MAG: PPC domain-containing protein [Nitrospirota bacterium]|nr:PPC domain-containing protein [Nitrospirota bacterium]
MKKLTTLAMPAIVASLFVGTSVFAQIVEQEPTDPISSSQLVSIPSSDPISITGVLGTIGEPAVADLDFYSFQGTGGDTVSIDIDNGWGGAQSVDTVIALFGPGPSFPLLVQNDDSPLDPGSTNIKDSEITSFTLPEFGVFTVGVSSYPRFFIDGGDVVNPTFVQNGDYTLIISGVTQPPRLALDVYIDIKPGNIPNVINPKSRGKVHVAILSTPEFDATTQVDTSSLTFGARGDEQSMAFCHGPQDVNYDGLKDLVCKFKTEYAQFSSGDTEGWLKGRTVDGYEIEGRDFIKCVPGAK